MSGKTKLCFVIAPIGSENSEIRHRSDQILHHIIEPTCAKCGYQATRADSISEPGIITSQIIQRLVNDDLVIADLTGRNANVFYELAIRHAVRKPVVHLIAKDESIPFDVSQSRAIQVDHHDLDSVRHCCEELTKHIQAAEKTPEVDTPISIAIDLQNLKLSHNPLEKSTGQIISLLQDIRFKIDDLSRVRPSDRAVDRAIRERLHADLSQQLALANKEISEKTTDMMVIDEKLASPQAEPLRESLHKEKVDIIKKLAELKDRRSLLISQISYLFGEHIQETTG